MTVGMEPQGQVLLTTIASADLTDKKYHFISNDGAVSGAGDQDTRGLLWSEGETGESVAVQTDGYGLARCPAGSKVTTGQIVTSDANGQAVVAAVGEAGYMCVKGAANNGGLALLDLNQKLRVHA